MEATMSKQTAVEWLEKCFASHWNYEEHAKWDGLIHQAKQIEKEQINETYWKALGIEASDNATLEYWLYKIASWHIIILLGFVIVAFWVWCFYCIWSML
jgi:hypothetical protein